jgi:hypothetical protein
MTDFASKILGKEGYTLSDIYKILAKGQIKESVKLSQIRHNF